MSKDDVNINRETSMVDEDHTLRIEASLNSSKARKFMIVSSKPCIPDLNKEPCSDSEEETEEKTQILTGFKRQDVIVSVPQLQFEHQVEILARFPCSEYWKLNFLNREFSEMLKSNKFFKLRKEWGIVKPYVFLHTGGLDRWMMFDKDFQSFQNLPQIPSYHTFFMSDKETICVGTQLIVIGRDLEGVVVWRYELAISKWFNGPTMITPRTMYASASHGNDAFFAGGIKTNENRISEVVSKVEKYNAETKIWTLVHEMHKRRKFCSGCFFRGKFYVIGGRDENDNYLSSGERYDEATDSWELIPNMLEGITFIHPHSPPLIAVVNDNLYLLEASFNELHIYDINKNVWKKLGHVPMRADIFGGWGVAFKSIGDRLLLIGASSVGSSCATMSVYTCRPSTRVKEPMIWEKSKEPGIRFHYFIRNCCVMFA